jgi:acetoin utilization deacetylase AcuC-like enzyme
MRTGLVYDQIFLAHDQPGHPEGSKRLEAIVTELKSSGLWEKATHLKNRFALVEEINYCHSKEYINYIKTFCEEGGGNLDADTYANKYSYKAAITAAGSLIDLVDTVLTGKLDNGFALLRPPGHHALSNRSMGFCVFGNVAIAAKAALKNSKIKKVAIVDIDVHHGNGTQALVENDSNILYVSTHQYPFYPGTGSITEIGKGDSEGKLLNVPLPPSVGNNGFTRIYNEIIVPKIEKFHPDLLLISAGYDAHWDDPLAEMGLSLSGYTWISKKLIETAKKVCDSKIIFALEGGYNLKVLSMGVANSLRALLGLEDFVDQLGKSSVQEPDISGLINELKKTHQL